jgi:hypothetical protein
MGVFGVSARGERVDFDLLKIKQQLAANPVNIDVQNRRKIIDVKNGLKPREVVEENTKKNALKVIDTSNEEVNEAFAIALQAAQVSSTVEVETKELQPEMDVKKKK